MSALTPSQIKDLCTQYNLAPSKQYGQHYLISDKPIQAMIEAGELTADDTVVEVGPGFGVLTLAVAPLVKRVVAFEIEKKLAGYWEEKVKEFPNVEIVWGNALFEFGAKSQEFGGEYKVLANLPYQITSKVLRTLVEAVPAPTKVIVMVQKEVAERMCAKAGSSSVVRPGRTKGEGMSLLGLSVQYYGAPKIVCKVPPGAFFPPPKVDSAVVAIDLSSPVQAGLRQASMKPSEEVFFQFARAGFSNPRKQLWRNLSEGLTLPGERVKDALRVLAGNDKIRAEELSFEQWENLVNQLGSYPRGGN